MPDQDPLTYLNWEKNKVNVTKIVTCYSIGLHFIGLKLSQKTTKNVSQFLMDFHQILTAPR